MSYFSDQELGAPAAVHHELSAAAWTGICATLNRFMDRQYFAAEFPIECPDGQGVCDTSRAGFQDLLTAHVPAFGSWPDRASQPTTLSAMDLVVFAWRHVQKPSRRDYHGFFRHDHLTFDQRAGREEWKSAVNEILSRNSVALRQEPDGRVVRLDGAAVAAVLSRPPLPSSGDSPLDGKVASALQKYRDPDVSVRREALEAIWDAFERVKTIVDPSDKKRSVAALIARITPDSSSQEELDAEFTSLTRIGNAFQIRHSEVGKHPVPEELIDLWFARVLSVVDASIRSI